VELGCLGLEQLASTVEHLFDDGVRVLLSSQRLREPVVSLQLFVAVVKLLVGAIRHQQHPEDDDQQGNPHRVLLQLDDEEKGDAGVAHRDQQPPGERLFDGVPVKLPFFQGDDGCDCQSGDLVGDDDRGEGGQDVAQAGGLGTGRTASQPTLLRRTTVQR